MVYLYADGVLFFELHTNSADSNLTHKIEFPKFMQSSVRKKLKE